MLASAMLLSVRQGRLQADLDRLDVRVLQSRQADSRVQSAELRAKRAQYLEEERARKEAAAAKKYVGIQLTLFMLGIQAAQVCSVQGVSLKQIC